MALCGFAGHNFDATVLIHTEHWCTMQHPRIWMATSVKHWVGWSSTRRGVAVGPWWTTAGRPWLVTRPGSACGEPSCCRAGGWFDLVPFCCLLLPSRRDWLMLSWEQMFNCCTALLINLIPNIYETKIKLRIFVLFLSFLLFDDLNKVFSWAPDATGRCYLLFTLCIFIAGQAVLGNSEESFEAPGGTWTWKSIPLEIVAVGKSDKCFKSHSDYSDNQW